MKEYRMIVSDLKEDYINLNYKVLREINKTPEELAPGIDKMKKMFKYAEMESERSLMSVRDDILRVNRDKNVDFGVIHLKPKIDKLEETIGNY
jgi:hypothetical protein